MWKPDNPKLEALLTILSSIETPDSWVQKDNYKSLTDLSQDEMFPNYLIYIFSSSLDISLKYNAGLLLKTQLEINDSIFTNDIILEYFKAEITSTYYSQDKKIKTILSIIINTFLQKFGIEFWPNILKIVEEGLEKEEGIEISIKVLNLILEDTIDNYNYSIDEKVLKYLNRTIDKVLSGLELLNNEEISRGLFVIWNICLDNYQDIMLPRWNRILEILKKYANCNSEKIKNQIKKSWLLSIYLNNEVLCLYYQDLITFYLSTNTYDQYEEKYTTFEFFSYLVLPEEDLMKNQNFKQTLLNNLPEWIPQIITNMSLSEYDISYLDNKFKNSNNCSENSDEEETSDIDKNNTHTNALRRQINDNTTLRKWCCRLLERLSVLFPKETFEIMKPVLETEIQSRDNHIKERSILAFGVIGKGCYHNVRSHLNNLVQFILREFHHPNKYIRAIACWTLSRFTHFILHDSNKVQEKFEFFRTYLFEILKRFLDNESIVRESANKSFIDIIYNDKAKVLPFWFDIWKLITSVFDNFAGLNLLPIYDVLVIIMENYSDFFKNSKNVDDIIKCIVQKWYSLVKENDLLTLPKFFDVIVTLIKVSGDFLINSCDYFLSGCLKIIEINMEELRINNNNIECVNKELLAKSWECLSILTQHYNNYIKNSLIKTSIQEYWFEIWKIKNLYITHYSTALLGAMWNAVPEWFSQHTDLIYITLIPNLEIKTNKWEMTQEKISVFNNSIWVCGCMCNHYPEESKKYFPVLIEKILQILTLPKMNKALAQNIAICIGKLCVINPEIMSNYLEGFIKQFCLSLRHLKNSPEKRDAFIGLCMCISCNPTAAFPSMIFLCDAFCNFENSNNCNDIEDNFRKIITGFNTNYEHQFKSIVTKFPNEWRNKVIKRFGWNI